jgi:hypothetical protein
MGFKACSVINKFAIVCTALFSEGQKGVLIMLNNMIVR